MIKESTPEYLFPKEEKLCREKSIDRLFSKGESFIAYPLRVVYLIENESDKGQSAASVLVSVSKKKFKRAVKRNRVKRMIREAYRLNKSNYYSLLQQHCQHVDIAFLYLKDELPNCSEIEKAMLKAMGILSEKLERSTGK